MKANINGDFQNKQKNRNWLLFDWLVNQSLCEIEQRSFNRIRRWVGFLRFDEILQMLHGDGFILIYPQRSFDIGHGQFLFRWLGTIPVGCIIICALSSLKLSQTCFRLDSCVQYAIIRFMKITKVTPPNIWSNSWRKAAIIPSCRATSGSVSSLVSGSFSSNTNASSCA